MIRRGRVEGWLKLPAPSLRPWANFNGVSFDGVRIGPRAGFESRGSAVVAETDLQAGDQADGAGPLMTVPKELILSLENVDLMGKADSCLKEVLNAIADFRKSFSIGSHQHPFQISRTAILVFLLHQATVACPGKSESIGLTTPFTEYVKFLPEELLPIFWTPAEQELLIGTTLRPALEAKLKSLEREFERLRSATEHIPWCKKYWWDEEDGLITFDDWKEVDSMYRSRALEWPGIGDCMVPCVDMANHASGDETLAIYETDQDHNAILLLRDGKKVEKEEEVTITYGDSKGACEMIFSYGFVEDTMDSARELFLDLQIPDDDPLKRAKMAATNAAPGVRIFDRQDGTHWESDFIWLVCINEEDGLDFRVLQQNDGSRELMMAWKDQDLSEGHKLLELLQADPMWEIFRLRAVALVQDRVESQLRLLMQTEHVQSVQYGEKTGIREKPFELVMRLRKLETDLLEKAYGDLEDEKTELAQTETVKNYLAQAHDEDLAEEDFS